MGVDKAKMTEFMDMLMEFRLQDRVRAAEKRGEKRGEERVEKRAKIEILRQFFQNTSYCNNKSPQEIASLLGIDVQLVESALTVQKESEGQGKEDIGR